MLLGFLVGKSGGFGGRFTGMRTQRARDTSGTSDFSDGIAQVLSCWFCRPQSCLADLMLVL